MCCLYDMVRPDPPSLTDDSQIIFFYCGSLKTFGGHGVRLDVVYTKRNDFVKNKSDFSPLRYCLEVLYM